MGQTAGEEVVGLKHVVAILDFLKRQECPVSFARMAKSLVIKYSTVKECIGYLRGERKVLPVKTGGVVRYVLNDGNPRPVVRAWKRKARKASVGEYVSWPELKRRIERRGKKEGDGVGKGRITREGAKP